MKQNIILLFLKLSHKIKKSKKPIDIFKNLSKAKSVLICMPNDHKEFNDALIVLDELVNTFLKAQCTILITGKSRFVDTLSASGKISTISQTDINFLGVPSKSIRHKLLSHDFDIAVDLNKNFDFVSTYLCISSKAALKICFSEKTRNDFYNFELRLSPDLSLVAQYQKFIRYLRAGMIDF